MSFNNKGRVSACVKKQLLYFTRCGFVTKNENPSIGNSYSLSFGDKYSIDNRYSSDLV